MKRTYQPKKLKTLRKRGFLTKMKSAGGIKLIKRRKAKGRKVLTVSDEYRLKDKKPNHRNR